MVQGFEQLWGNQEKNPKLRNQIEKLRGIHFDHHACVFIFRGPQLKQHFRHDKSNRALPPNDRLKYISQPTFYWCRAFQKKPAALNIRNFRAPLDFLRALFTDAIIDNICETTEPLTYDNCCVQLTKEMFFKFIGMELMRGVIGVRNVKNMWTVEGGDRPVILYPGRGNALAKNHWFAISYNLDYDASFVHSLLVGNFKLHMHPGFHVTVDELRIPCHHVDCPLKSHNRDKPDIWAIESKCLHAENGYLLDFVNPTLEKVPTPGETVFRFANWLTTTGRKHHMVMDSNFVSALDLLKLHDMGVFATASCKSTRPSFIWKQGLAHRLPRGYSRVASSNRLCCIATRSKGLPKLATTLCYAVQDPIFAEVKERRKLLKIYDTYKGKADYFGHLNKAQFPQGHHKSWLSAMLVGWFYFAVTNAFILYSTRFADLTHEEFVYQIACDLMLMK
jgi:hypothetical protein